MKKLAHLIIIVIIFALSSCQAKYSDEQVQNADFKQFIDAMSKVCPRHQSFLDYIVGKDKIDSLALEDYDEVCDILYFSGFEDPEFFVAIFNKTLAYQKAILSNINDEFYPGIEVNNFDMMESGISAYKKLLENDNLDTITRNNYLKLIEELTNARNTLTIKNQTNKEWIDKIRSIAQKETNINLNDNDILNLATFVWDKDNEE